MDFTLTCPTGVACRIQTVTYLYKHKQPDGWIRFERLTMHTVAGPHTPVHMFKKDEQKKVTFISQGMLQRKRKGHQMPPAKLHGSWHAGSEPGWITLDDGTYILERTHSKLNIAFDCWGDDNQAKTRSFTLMGETWYMDKGNHVTMRVHTRSAYNIIASKLTVETTNLALEL